MPLIANTSLPSFKQLEQEGMTVLSPDRAADQTIRELHIGILNMMPDTANSTATKNSVASIPTYW